MEPWGFKLEKKLITNSLGFRDFTNKKIAKKGKKKRLLLIGDSAIEGAGYDYEFTLGGLLQNHLIKILESGMSQVLHQCHRFLVIVFLVMI